MAEEATKIYDHGNADVDFKKSTLSNLARVVLLRYREAVMWAGTERVGPHSLTTTLHNCYEQFNSIISAEDAAVVEALGVGSYINITTMKVDLVQAYLQESIVQDEILPFTVKPTPQPELSAQGRLEVLEAVKREIFANGFDGDLNALIKETKSATLIKEKEVCEEKAQNMMRLMQDQIVEGGWRSAIRSFLTDICVYPHAIIHGPIATRSLRRVWTGDKLTSRFEKYYKFNCVSPWDFWYSPDSQDTQTGTGLFIRQRWTRRDLLEARQLKSYNASAIDEVLKQIETDKDNYNFNWMSINPDQPDYALHLWSSCSGTIDTLVHYGRFSGYELSEHNVQGLDLHQYYDACITMVGDQIIQIAVQKNPHMNQRPVFTASFYKHRERIPNEGIAQRLRDLERCFMYNLRCLMRNAANASEPIVEMDYSRLIKHMSPQDLGAVVPGMVFFTDSDFTGSSAPAVRPSFLPDHMPSYSQLMDKFMEYAHLVTNLPASLHGMAVGTGANRTFRGISLLQSNALKAIQAAVANMDEGVFSKIGEVLYNHNMMYSDDPDIKGDAKVYAQGVDGLLQKGIDRQNSLEILQLVGAAGAQLAGVMDVAPLMVWAMRNAFKNMDVPDNVLPRMLPQQPGGAPGGQPAPAADGAPPVPGGDVGGAPPQSMGGM